MDELREQLMQSYFNQMSEGMQNLDARADGSG